MDKKFSVNKICNKCNCEKLINDFHRDNSKSDGYKNYCKSCQKIYSSKFYSENRDSIITYSKEYYNEVSNDDNYKLKRKIYMESYLIENKEKKKEYNKQYNINNKDSINKSKRIYNSVNKEKRKEYKKNNIEKVRESANNWVKNKIKTDELFHLSLNIRNLIRISIKKRGFVKKSKTHDILGCSFIEFKTYLESKFESWMSWNNHGLYNGELRYGWDMDHIIPISSAETEDDIVRLNHYTNFQPLDSYHNRVIKKHNVTHG